MSGIYVRPTTARAVLTCDRCRKEWRSALYEPKRWNDEVRACAPAWPLGWRVFVGGEAA